MLKLKANKMAKMTKEEVKIFKLKFNALNYKQRQRIRDKANWEHCTLLSVYLDYPDLFESNIEDKISARKIFD
jgi:hypothetical protein